MKKEFVRENNVFIRNKFRVFLVVFMFLFVLEIGGVVGEVYKDNNFGGLTFTTEKVNAFGEVNEEANAQDLANKPDEALKLWDDIPNNKQKNVIETELNSKKFGEELTSKQITQIPGYEDLVKNNKDFWQGIKSDAEKTTSVLKDMGYENIQVTESNIDGLKFDVDDLKNDNVKIPKEGNFKIGKGYVDEILEDGKIIRTDSSSGESFLKFQSPSNINPTTTFDPRATGCNGPGCQLGGQPSSSGGSSGGGSGGGGGGEQGFLQALQQAMSAVGKAIEFGSGLKEIAKSKQGKGPGKLIEGAPAGGNMQVAGNGEVTVDDDTIFKEDEEKYALAQPNEDNVENIEEESQITGRVISDIEWKGGKAVLRFNDGLSDLDVDNTDIGFVNDNQAIFRVYSPKGRFTNIINQPETRDSFSPKNSIDKSENNEGYLDYNQGGNSVTGNAINMIGGQHVHLVGQSVDIVGENIILDAFKSFKEVFANGEDLEIRNGQSKIVFKDDKTYYPRRIKYPPNNIHTIVNEQDTENYFKLRNYDTQYNFLSDHRKRVSVGNDLIVHPKIRSVRIAEIRQKMWKNNILS